MPKKVIELQHSSLKVQPPYIHTEVLLVYLVGLRPAVLFALPWPCPWRERIRLDTQVYTTLFAAGCFKMLRISRASRYKTKGTYSRQLGTQVCLPACLPNLPPTVSKLPPDLQSPAALFPHYNLPWDDYRGILFSGAPPSGILSCCD